MVSAVLILSNSQAQFLAAGESFKVDQKQIINENSISLKKIKCSNLPMHVNKQRLFILVLFQKAIDKIISYQFMKIVVSLVAVVGTAVV
jgi:hypothetical protein